MAEASERSAHRFDLHCFRDDQPLLARETGLEPATSGVTGRRSNQLSYSRSGRAHDLRRMHRRVKPPCGLLALFSRQAHIFASARLPDMGGDGFEPPTLSV